ncbi:MAG TPA: RNA polymerase sigma factor [Polyangiaceae bacterium]|jgi:RNA polymerase sigma-70 factor (ECF subfamily)|nr:RNA polymerase sigma factor [Polyangiaceae bacterium]
MAAPSCPAETTERLLVHWRSGDREAGNQLLHRYVPELTGFFHRRSAGNTDELVQRTLLACTQSLAGFEGRSTFRTYLYGIARNQYLMFRRAEAFASRTPVTLATLPDESPSQLAAVRQEQVLVMLALQRVEPIFSVVLKKYYWEDQSLADIGRELGVPVGTVKSRLARGRGSLKANLAKTEVRHEVRTAALRELSSWFAARGDGASR